MNHQNPKHHQANEPSFEEVSENESIIETDAERIQREKEEAHARSLQMRKKALPILATCLGVMIVIPLVLVIVLSIINKEPEYELVELPEYQFCKPYNGNILEYEEYLAKDREIYYWESSEEYGMQYTVTDAHEDAKLRFLYQYLQTIIQGDFHTYNSYFNSVYYQTSEPKSNFAQQMLYDIKLFYESAETEQNGERLITYRVEYKIMQNNGTFRTDIGSDMMRAQYLTLHEYSNGSILIEKLLTARTVVEKK